MVWACEVTSHPLYWLVRNFTLWSILWSQSWFMSRGSWETIHWFATQIKNTFLGFVLLRSEVFNEPVLWSDVSVLIDLANHLLWKLNPYYPWLGLGIRTSGVMAGLSMAVFFVTFSSRQKEQRGHGGLIGSMQQTWWALTFREQNTKEWCGFCLVRHQ